MDGRVSDATTTQLRERSRAYESGSPERDAFLVALVRYEYAEEDARIDAVLMRSWRARGVYGG
ncbi:MAG: hypothetical protein ACJ780_10305 [Solirubrobacteraceae bacterium]|jgi:hypothetical protein